MEYFERLTPKEIKEIKDKRDKLDLYTMDEIIRLHPEKFPTIIESLKRSEKI